MGKTAFLFPGQGAQTVGMGKVLYDTLPAAKALFDKADEILGYSLTDLCFNGPMEQLSTTAVSQPALYVTSLAALESLKVSAPEAVEACSAAAGLSLGEYTALAFAGVLSFEDGLRLVQRRGQAMQEAADATPSGMVSLLGPEVEVVEDLCAKARGEEILQVANLLCPGNTVVSGTRAACERVVALAEETGAARAVPLAVAGAFHTPIMRPADEKLAEVLANVQISAPRIPVISNVDVEVHTDADDIRATLVRQLLSPVQWEKTMRKLMADGYDTFYEVGPGRVLRGLMKRIDRKMPCQGVDV
ncbi:MAG: ACP S-malonyltransferase [Thermoguttaceae bacterium]|nr:ACP S-malonyltransferase [Thermoguttaceae bacterium]MBP3695327.1 ACP S-malonyltransferase [Thermoguttaceae bacterium]